MGKDTLSLSEAIENLHYKRGSIFEFKPVGSVDDRKFREANPEHPMAEPQRFIRINAADFLNDLATREPTLFDASVLQELHQALFDRCAAVRMAIAEALGKLGSPESISAIQQLLEVEDESQWVRKALEVALHQCRCNKKDLS